MSKDQVEYDSFEDQDDASKSESLEDFFDGEIPKPENNVVDLYWHEMPEFKTTIENPRKIIVTFKTDEAVRDFAERLNVPITEKTKSMNWPHESHVSPMKQFWVEEGSPEDPDNDNQD